MNAAMHAAVDFISAEGPMLLAGGTLLLAAGALATFGQRSPAARQRAAELTMFGVLVWMVLACVPLPRNDRSRWFSSRESRGTTQGKSTALDGAVVEMDSRGDAAEELDAVMAELPEELLIELPAKRRRDAGIEDDRIAGNVAAAIATAGGRSSGAAPGPESGFGPVDWRHLGAIIYLSGAIGSLAWLLLGRALLCRVVRVAEPAEPWLAALFAQAVNGMAPCRAATRTRLLVSRRCRRPFSCGLWRPAIVLPAGGCRPAQAERLRSVLLHELGHIGRGDAWGHQLFHLGLPFWFFHPLYWYLRSAAQLSRELIADDCAARHSSPEAYVRQLIALARETGLGPAPSAVTAIFTSRTQFYRRMTMLIRRESPLATRCTLAWRGAALVSLVFAVGAAAWTLGVESIAAQTPPDKKAAPEVAAQTDTTRVQDKRDQATPAAEKPNRAVLEVDVQVRDAKQAPENVGTPGADNSEQTAEVKKEKPAPGLVTVEIGSDSSVAVDEIQSDDLEAEFARLEKQIEALRARLAKAQDTGATPPPKPKKWDVWIEKVPGTTRVIRTWEGEQLNRTDDAKSDALPGNKSDAGVIGTLPENTTDGTTRNTVGDPFAAPTAAGRQSALEASVGGLHLDLVRLAEAYADAVGGVEIAKARLQLAMAAANELNAIATVRDEINLRAEIKIQEVSVRTAERKLSSLRRIAEVVTGAAEDEAKSCEDDFKRMQQLPRGIVPGSQLRDAMRQYQAAQANLKTLLAILAE
ncbi:MAG TPA: M56 family metallopeptidase [Pirellulales bacterium]|nr:M56 family metallopeptidase [Pirellulales bacterium]